jgi:flagella basal body P-ring formation protein FlgA
MREMSAHYIEAKVRHTGIDTSEVRLDIPEKIQVAIKTVEVSSQKIEKIVGQFIFEKMPWDPKQVSIKFSGTKDIYLSAGKVTYEVVPRKKEDYLGNSNLLVVFMVGGREAKRIWVTAHIDVNQEVVVSTHPLKRHYIITKEDICLKKMNLKELPKDVITNPSEVIGKRTRRTVDPDAPLRLNCLEVPPLVRRGDLVTILVETEVLKITTQGVVSEDGGKGEMVKVINTGSRREVFARVIDSRTVEIEL